MNKIVPLAYASKEYIWRGARVNGCPEETLRSGENNSSPRGIQVIRMEIQTSVSLGKI